MAYVDVIFGGLEIRARLLDDVAPAAVAAFTRSLPLTATAHQDQYSAQVMRVLSRVEMGDVSSDHRYGYEQPGLVMLDPANGQISVCYGRGRLQTAIGPVTVLPIADMGGDLAAFTTRGDRLQFDGAAPISFRLSADQSSPLSDGPLQGRRITLTLAGVRATAVLLESVSPKAAAAFAAALPLAGTATNTYGSGPLTRFWNPAGGKEGETPLDVPDGEINTTTLYRGGYYLGLKPWRGIRIAAQDPTAMSAGRGLLAPVFRFVGDAAAFRAEAAKLTLEGRKDLAIELA